MMEEKRLSAGREPGVTDLAEKLPFGAVVPVEITVWEPHSEDSSSHPGCHTASWRLTRADLLAITIFEVRDEILVSPVLAEIGDQRKFINFELLIFRGMGIIKRPLLEWDVSADKI
ncbi:MAG: hypothetical protein ACLRT5_01110 [Lachnospiraceae bacterium]